MSRLYQFTLFFVLLSLSLNAQDKYIPFLEVEDAPKTVLSSSFYSFTQAGGLIIVEAMINGVYQDFILDTGASSLILNKQPDNVSNQYLAVGVNGTTEVEEVQVEEFIWNEIKVNKVDAYVLNLSHIENILNQKIGGLIGQNIIEDKEMYIDYENKIIRFLDRNDKEQLRNMKVIKSIPFELDNHFPMIVVKMGKKKFRFAIDTGCEINLIEEQIIDQLSSRIFTAKETKAISGADSSAMSGTNMQMKKISIGGKSYKKMKLTATSLAYLNQNKGNDIDGILGYPFLKQHKISINFEKQRIYFWE